MRRIWSFRPMHSTWCTPGACCIIHPNTPKAISEVHRVLRPGGVAKVMIYHKWSLVGYMLWIRYALLRLRPWMTLTKVYARYLESPGHEGLFDGAGAAHVPAFSAAQIRTVLTHGDLLESAAGQRHGGVLLSLARRIWPRRLLQNSQARTDCSC